MQACTNRSGLGGFGWVLGSLLLVAGLSSGALAQDAPPAAGPAAPAKTWEASLSLGGSLRSGDENRYAGSGALMVKRLWSQDTLTYRALGDYGKTGSQVDTNDFGTSLEWRHDWSGRFFWLSTTGLDSDAVQGRNLRFTVNSGPGYRVWQQSKNEYLDVSSGLGYRHEEFRRGVSSNDLLDLRAGYEYQDKIGEVLEISHRTEIFAPANEIRNFLAKSELTLLVPLFKGLHFRNNARYEYVNHPADGMKSSNFWLTIGLEYKLDG